MNKYILLLFVFSFTTVVFSQEDTVFQVVEDMPIFNKKCLKFKNQDEKQSCSLRSVQQYIRKVPYPQKAIKLNITGKVWMQFIIEKNGEVSGIKVLRSSKSTILDQAAISHLRKMPKWLKPGKQRGKNVRVSFNVPIHFKLSYL